MNTRVLLLTQVIVVFGAIMLVGAFLMISGKHTFGGLIISGTGAALGVTIAGVLAILTRTLLPPEFSVPVPWFSVVLAIGVSCVTGLLFGYLPANKAAKLHPTESLRYE